MNDPETLIATLRVGAGVAFVAVVLYLTTSRGERSGFRLFPASAREWAQYWFRSLILAVLSAMPISRSSDIGGTLLAVSAFLLFGSSLAFWQDDRRVCVAGLTSSVIAFLWALLFPQISTACT